ncbi:hypothetical protein [Mycoplasma nasistruthionis]|uniref:Uncharacterized protein n=1 Tax=Mycoplasma nasistruthionis TaxID=353852 RepID=A0A5B7XVL8_9MOLU|nr:hypothetical protein [Mycoplasma nasistruthionis]QCZ36908.1 hypothetical protein FG904_02745 [Mycoplasma nasistruthionis]
MSLTNLSKYINDLDFKILKISLNEEFVRTYKQVFENYKKSEYPFIDLTIQEQSEFFNEFNQVFEINLYIKYLNNYISYFKVLQNQDFMEFDKTLENFLDYSSYNKITTNKLTNDMFDYKSSSLFTIDDMYKLPLKVFETSKKDGNNLENQYQSLSNANSLIKVWPQLVSTKSDNTKTDLFIKLNVPFNSNDQIGKLFYKLKTSNIQNTDQKYTELIFAYLPKLLSFDEFTKSKYVTWSDNSFSNSILKNDYENQMFQKHLINTYLYSEKIKNKYYFKNIEDKTFDFSSILYNQINLEEFKKINLENNNLLELNNLNNKETYFKISISSDLEKNNLAIYLVNSADLDQLVQISFNNNIALIKNEILNNPKNDLHKLKIWVSPKTSLIEVINKKIGEI